MARIRTIKPRFFSNEILGKMDPLARLLFIGLWTEADCEGRLEDRPKRLKVEVLPFDDCDIDSLLAELEAGKFICRYEAQERRVIQIINFLRHQHPHPKEIKHDLPPMPGLQSASRGISCNSTEIMEEKEISGKGDLWYMDHGEEERPRNGREAKATRRSSAAPAPTQTQELAELQAEPAYQHIDVTFVYEKMIAWCKRTGKQPSRQRLLNWLNREEPSKARQLPKRLPDPGRPPQLKSEGPKQMTQAQRQELERLAREFDEMGLSSQAENLRKQLQPKERNEADQSRSRSGKVSRIERPVDKGER